MQRGNSILRIFVLTLLSVVLATSAQAGRWSVVYDLTGSNLETVNPGGTYNDPITGTVTVEYDATASGAPLAGGRLVTGDIAGSLNQDAGIIVVTGSNTNTLLPGYGGTPGAIVGNELQLAVVADHSLTGFLHCADVTGGTAGFCNQFFATPASNNIPQSGSGTFAFPSLNFVGTNISTGNFGAFTTDPVTSVPQASVTTTLTYVGTEVSRTWIAGDLPVAGIGGLVALLGGITATGFAVARRKLA